MLSQHQILHSILQVESQRECQLTLWIKAVVNITIVESDTEQNIHATIKLITGINLQEKDLFLGSHPIATGLFHCHFC